MDQVLFFGFALGTFWGAYLIVSKIKIIYSILGFLLITLMVAGLLAMLGAELPAVSQILVYSGGLVVLLLFAMALSGPMSSSRAKLKPPVILMSLMLAWFFGKLSLNFTESEVSTQSSDLKAFSVYLFTQYFLPFELLGLMLLLVLVACLYLVFN
jgi:NADH-quinone oxidoreductase subunit J